MLAALVDQVFRRERGRVLATLTRQFGDLDLAEDALQDACAEALRVWPGQGLPDQPGAWLVTVARRRALDRRRRQRGHASAEFLLPVIAGALDEDACDVLDSGVEDDRLRLLFTCCHPALAAEAQAALALRTLCGLTTREIARAFLEPETTTAQRLVRVKRKIREAAIPYVVPAQAELGARLHGVLATIYLVFNEGYAASSGDALLRPDLCVEGIRLGRLVLELLPDSAEARGLLALMLLHEARRAARVDADGALVALDEQDRRCWDRARITEGIALLDTALCLRQPGPYQIQAAIAALHGQAHQASDTDWAQISALYGALLRYQPGAIVELNAAVALAMASGPDAGLAWLQQLQQRGELDAYHLLPAAQADLLRRACRYAEAREAYARAIVLAANPVERAYLARRCAGLPPG